MGQVLILYGTETGNSAELANVVTDRVRRLRLVPRTMPFGEASLSDIVSARTLIVICATTGQGALPKNTQPLWNRLLRKNLSPSLLSGLRLAAFGLGDTSYPRYNWAIRKVHSRLLQLGARDIVERGEGDEMSTDGPEIVFTQWLDIAMKNIAAELEISDIIPVEELLPPFYHVEMGNKIEDPRYCRAGLSRPNLAVGKVVQNTRLTAQDHFQDVRHISIQVADSPEYAPGDVLVLYPPNSDSNVNTLLESQGWLDIADSKIDVDKSWSDTVAGGIVDPLTLRMLFKWHLDLNGIPRRTFFALAAHFAEGREREKMQEFASGSEDGLQDLYDYANRPRRSILETITEFETLRLPLKYILDLFPLIRPRQFSIASRASNPQIDLCVAVVKYRTVLRRIRRGLCTSWLSSLPPGDEVQVSLEHTNSKLIERMNACSHAVMVATGTGIAPIRSILMTYEGECDVTLFFGCRFSEADFLYGQLWDEVKKSIKLKVIPAFSREGGGYVQQQIVSHRDTLKNVLIQSLVFICGSSGKMPEAVREAFGEVLGDQQVIYEKEKRGSYVQETW